MNIFKIIINFILIKLIFKIIENIIFFKILNKIDLGIFANTKGIIFIGQIQKYLIINVIKTAYIKRTNNKNSTYYESVHNIMLLGFIITIIINTVILCGYHYIYSNIFNNFYSVLYVCLEAIFEYLCEIILINDYLNINIKFIGINESLTSFINTILLKILTDSDYLDYNTRFCFCFFVSTFIKFIFYNINYLIANKKIFSYGFKMNKNNNYIVDFGALNN